MSNTFVEPWTEARVQDIASGAPRSIAIGPFGSRLKAELYVTNGFPVIRGQDIGPGKALLEEKLVYVPEAVAESLPGCVVGEGDLIFPHRGAIGQVGIVGQRQFLLSSSMMKLTCNRALIDPGFLFYYFRGPGRDELLTRASTVGTPGIGQPLKSLRGIPIRYPGLPQQRAIAEVLGALDDKIAANTKLAETADALSQAVFRSIAGEVTSVPLSTTARFVNGRAFTKGASGAGRVVIRIAELNSGLGGSTVFSDAEVSDDFLARPGDILFAWSGSLTLHRWFRSEAIVNQHIFKVIPNGHPSWLVYELLRDRLTYFKGIAADKATTMGHIQRGHLDELVGVPSSPSIDRVDELMASLWDRALLAERENETLAATRDALLPQLMSGKLRVRDAEKTVEAVV